MINSLVLAQVSLLNPGSTLLHAYTVHTVIRFVYTYVAINKSFHKEVYTVYYGDVDLPTYYS